MWEAIKRLQQGKSLNIQDVKTNLFWEFGKFTSHYGETIESYYTRFYKLMNEMIRNNLNVTTMQQHKLDEVSYHKLFDILKQYQNEVNELRAEKLARNANPLALVATAQASQDLFYQSSRSHRSQAPSSKPSIPTRSHTTTRHKGKEIAKPITPPSKTASKEDSRENVGSQVVQQYGIQCFNCREYGHFAKECRKPKRYDWLEDTDEEVDEQELEAHYSYMAKIQEVPTADSGTDSEPVEQNDQNDVENNDEHVALANLIANLKLDVDENKKIQKQLKKTNITLAQELKECKTILAETSKSLGESISVRDSCLVALQTKQAEFEKYKAFNDCTIDYDNLEHKLNEALGQLAQKTLSVKPDGVRLEDVLNEYSRPRYKIKTYELLAKQQSSQDKRNGMI
nr:hypothetical protein [Tanacetum cinerariifolium]